jgi:hypothetical protein
MIQRLPPGPVLHIVLVSPEGRTAKVIKAGLVFFCMAAPWVKMKIHEYAWKFIRIWPEIVDAAEHSKGPLFEVAGGKALTVRPMPLTY